MTRSASLCMVLGCTTFAFGWQSNEILDRSFGIRQVASQCAFTEGPVVDHQGILYFSDGPNDRIMKLDKHGRQSVFLSPCGAANGLLFDLEGRLLMCQSSRPGGGRAVARTSTQHPRRDLSIVTADYGGKPYIAPNDLCLDAVGNIYFTDPYYDGEKSQPTSGVYRIAPSGKTTLLIDNLLKPNGILITENDEFVYVSDRGTQKLHRYRLTADKQLKEDSVIYDFSPDRGIDGMWLDKQGNIYGAAGEGKTTGLFVISPHGKLLLHQPLPEFATNVTFGGPDMKDIYVTATTSVYHMRARIPGVRHRYQRNQVEQALTELLQQQAAAWNRGKIDEFMQYYWKSEQLTFSSGGNVRRGWEATKRSYETRYPDQKTMGKVRFSDLEITSLGPTAAMVLGRWQLEREDPIGGNFTLVFRRIDDAWKIIHDHTSLLE